jgi:hypothetical protein
MYVVIAIFVVHFLADFVFQSSKMATGKSKSLKWLSIHVGVYGLVTCVSAYCISFTLFSPGDVIIWWAGNVGLHFMVDFFTSKITSRLWEEKNMRLFFVMIGFDQLLHNICLLGTYYFILDHQLIVKP